MSNSFSKSAWADGRPSVEAAGYEYSGAFLAALLRALLGAQAPAVQYDGLDTYVADFVFEGAAASAHMDPWSCSIAFADVRARDRALERLAVWTGAAG